MREKIEQIAESLREEAVRLLQSLIRIPSVNPPGQYEEIAPFLQRKMSEWGMKAELYEVPPDYLKRLGLKERRINVVGSLNGSLGKPTLIFNNHLDTVPVTDREKWICDPFSGEIIDGKIYGRGAMDSKARIVSYMLAARAIKEAGFPLKGNVLVTSTCDEESGGLAGAGYLVREKIIEGDYAIVEGFTESIIYAMCGVLHLEVNVEGKACHAMDPDKGINAIQKMAKVISRIEQHYQVLRQRRSSIPGILSSTASVGTIKGGVKTNVVPDFCSITIDRRIVPGETGEKAKEELVAIFNDLMKQDPDLKLKWNEVMVADPYVSDQNSILIQILKKNSKQILGTDLPVEGLGGFSDGRFFANDMGIPTVHYGPGQLVEGRPHGVNENVRIDDLVKVAKVCALTIMDLLG